MSLIPPSPKRECGDCAKCCEGWLYGNIYGHQMHRERPCFYLQKTCTIYENRPDNPCKSYECSWLSDTIFPMWMKPNLVNIIITKRTFKNEQTNEDEEYYEVFEAGSTIDSKTLNWLLIWSVNNQKNLYYQINGSPNRIGSPAFLKATL
jgi:hypothetical protein